MNEYLYLLNFKKLKNDMKIKQLRVFVIFFYLMCIHMNLNFLKSIRRLFIKSL
jgi:hypothetical protein